MLSFQRSSLRRTVTCIQTTRTRVSTVRKSEPDAREDADLAYHVLDAGFAIVF